MIPSPSSWPWSGRPASRRRVSRAPSPAGAAPAPSTASKNGPAASPWHRALDAVLAGVAGPRGQAVGALPRRRGRPGSGRRRPPRAPPWPARWRAAGPWTATTALEPVTSRPPTAAKAGAGVRGVGHDVEPLLGHPPHDEVVDDRTVVVEQVRVLGPAGPDPAQVVGEGRLQPVEGVGPLHPQGAEVAHVEGHGVGAAGAVLGHGAGGIRERHLPAPELDHPGPEGQVDGVQGGASSGRPGHRPPWAWATPIATAA